MWGEAPYIYVLTRDELQSLVKDYAEECRSTDVLTQVHLGHGSSLSRTKAFYGSRLAHIDDLLGGETVGEMLEDLYGEVDFAADRASQEGKLARHHRVGRFLEERCIRDHSGSTFEPRLLEAFREWCRGNGEESMSRKKFRRSMQYNGIGRCKDAVGQQYFGINLAGDQPPQLSPDDPFQQT